MPVKKSASPDDALEKKSKKPTTSHHKKSGKKKVVKKASKHVDDVRDTSDDDISTDDHREFVLTELGEDTTPKTKKIEETETSSPEMSEQEEEQFEEDEKMIDERLTEIYENKDGSMPDMKTFQKRKRNAFVRAFFVLLFSALLFAVVAWVGLFVIQPRTQFSEDDVTLTITGNEDVAPGEEVTYRVRYRNAQSVALHQTTLEIRYPKGFQFVTSTREPSNEDHDIWQLDTLDAQGGGYIDITGRMNVNKDDDVSFRGFLNYVPENFSSDFQTVSALSIRVANTIAQVDIEMPSDVPVGAEVPLGVLITPLDDQVLTHVRVECQGDNFKISDTSDPVRADKSVCAWDLTDIHDPTHLSFAGSFGVEAPTDFIVNIRGFETDDMSDEGFIIASKTVLVIPVVTATSLNLAVNGSVSDSTVVPGDDIITTLVIKNNGDTIMENVVINLTYDAPSYQNRSLLGWTNIQMSDDGDIFGEQINEAIRRGTITWNKNRITGLKSMKPGDEVAIDVTLPIKSGSETTLANYESGEIHIAGNVSYTLGSENKTQDILPITLTLVADVSVDVQDDISEDVEGNTVHTVTWLLSNSYHDLSGITLEADIYGDVSVDTEQIVVPAGDISYDAEKKKLVWTIDTMPTSVDVLGLQFDITLLSDNPTQTQLTSTVKGRATDDVLQSKVVFVGSAIEL